jgi:UDP-galactopyranose mutase
MTPFRHRVIATTQKRMYSIPINLLTINQFFNRTMSPEEARAHLAKVRRQDIANPQNFEEQALSMMGDDLYRAFFRGYTVKQWGRDPTELPASILKRLPMRLDYDDSYFAHKYQAIPRDGYTSIIANILEHPNILVKLGRTFEHADHAFDHIAYSGPIDRFFNFDLGRLEYRTLDFETFYASGDFQGAAVVNYCDEETPWTRITEHQHFAPWERGSHQETILYREYSRRCEPKDIPYYPIRLIQEQALLRKYVDRAEATGGVTFVGRLGTYRYIDMDVCIGEAIKAGEVLRERFARDQPPPAFMQSPL